MLSAKVRQIKSRTENDRDVTFFYAHIIGIMSPRKRTAKSQYQKNYIF
jgi:hypothetical protein